MTTKIKSTKSKGFLTDPSDPRARVTRKRHKIPIRKVREDFVPTKWTLRPFKWE